LPQHPLSTAIRLIAYLSKRTRVIAVSNATAKAFCGTLRFNNRVCTIHNGTDLGRFPRKQPGSSKFRQEAGIPDRAFLVCSVGQICARKGLRELLDAFSRIYKNTPQMHLAVVGKVVFQHEDKYGDSLRAIAAASGTTDRVHFTGERRDVSAVLQAADLLVLNSIQEPFGLVLIEAMSSGTPVVATRVGGIPEIVRDSENGWLVESGDTAGLASKLVELSHNSDMLARVARVAYDTTCPQFSLDRFQNNLHTYYAELKSQPAVEWKAHRQVAVARSGNHEGGSHV
jgi:glycosyltransferase involved in cell wall biosynthesis